MKTSIIAKPDNLCYFCARYGNLEKHHCIHGTANRRLADEDGLFVWLCHNCHMQLHDKGIGDKGLQIVAEKAWMSYYGKTEEDFIKRYGKNYILE